MSDRTRIERDQRTYRNSRPSMLGRGIERLTNPFAKAIASVVPDWLMERVVRGIDSAASAPELTRFDHDSGDITACKQAAKKVEARAKAINGASGVAAGFGGALTAGADIPATIAVAVRTIRDTGRAYGFAGVGTAEQLFRMQILELSALNDPDQRQRAIAGIEAAIGPDGELVEADPDRHGALVDQAVERVSRAIAFASFRKRAGMVMPVVGSAVGGIVNASFQGDVAAAARFAFQERRLRRMD
ncbi:EcsC family protein [Erythrobacter sp. 3-20A1M]|uniref:EcsC family protein n=1 Tax=Erythrobacter sp. 3-20A1M TaxID=2653850 RepID=UPI001BFC4261|nr:EcsC family protein [Erythrobacter sp. 3-20A1M]QWC56860.1 EcsC family protein [Erythrobacter sp. 3-20A1M]